MYNEIIVHCMIKNHNEEEKVNFFMAFNRSIFVQQIILVYLLN